MYRNNFILKNMLINQFLQVNIQGGATHWRRM